MMTEWLQSRDLLQCDLHRAGCAGFVCRIDAE